MLRIGRMPIAIPAGITVIIVENNPATVKGPKGTLGRVLPAELEIKREDSEITATRPNNLERIKSLYSLTRILIRNMVVGIIEGYEKVLEISGVGHRAVKQESKLVLPSGYSHPVEMEDPEGVTMALDSQNIIRMQGTNKEKVGQYAAMIRERRLPEPYKDEGIKHATETIRRRVGKIDKK